jgi:ligand-binding sensor domain-containing protein
MPLHLALTLALFFCFYGKGSTQTNDLRFEKIGFEQGLSGETVIAILQDSKGYMWFGTLDGLNKYDGYSFTKYQFDPHDTNSISQNLVYTIFEDSEGTIWISTFEGLCRFDRYTEKFTRYKPLKTARYADPNITVISEDTEGMLWVGSASGGLCRFDKKKGVFLPEYYDLGYQHAKDDKADFRDAVNCIYKDKAGTLWIGNTTGLHKLKLTGKKAGQLSQVSFTHYQNNPADFKSLSSNLVSSIFEDRTGILWIATDNGLNSFDRKTGVFKRYQHNPKNKHSISSDNFSFWIGNRIKEDKEGNLWIATNKGLNKLNKERTNFTAYLHKPNDGSSISSDVIFSLEIDRAGILWAGGWNAKLNKADLHHKPFSVVRHDPGNDNSLSNNLVTSVLEDATGMIWIGTFQGGLNRWDRKSNHFKRFRHDATNPESLRSDSVNAILEDRHGCFWVCNGDVLSKLNKTTGTFKHYSINDNSGKADIQQMLYCIEEDHEGLLWLGSENGLYSFDEKTGKFRAYYYNPRDTTNGISDYTAIAIFADSKDQIWIGHGSIATDRFDKKTGRFTHYKYDPNNPSGISSNIVHDFYEDANGNIWLGTSAGGLCYWDKQTEKFTTFSEKQGLASNTIHSILEDDEKQIWLCTRNGISKFDPVSKIFTHYDYNDGLQGNLFAAGDRERAAHFKGKDGTLYFGGIDGLVFFDPSKMKANRQEAPIVITQFKLFDSIIKGAHELKEIVLNYNQNYFSFEFSSLSFYNPAKNQYAYKLEGVDKDWVYSGSRRYVGYTNINPGKYTFRIKGTNNDGIWNEKGAFLILTVKPPWWRTWWAYTLFVLAFAGLLYAYLRYRLTKIRMQHEIVLQKHKASELEMQALRSQMNPHFIFNSLNSINSFILQNNKR